MSDIKKGSRYYVDGSDLLIKVLNIAYSGGGYIKARLWITNRYNGILYEDRYYKLDIGKISHWKEYV
jgi:hypothetical protein